MNLNTAALQRLLYRIAVKRLIESFDAERDKAGISQRQLSEEAGMAPNAFSGTKSEIEDLHISTFLRYYCASSRILKSRGQDPININDLIRSSSEIINLASQFSLVGPGDFSTTEIKLFKSLKGDAIIVEKRGAANQEELDAFNSVYDQFEQKLQKG